MANGSDNPFANKLNGASGGVAVYQELEGGPRSQQFRYSRSGFRYNLTVALALTALFCGFVWLIIGVYGTIWHNAITAVTGLVFFAFISARMLGQYWRDEVVLAVQPTGLYDGRISSEAIAWDRIKELVLLRREQEYQLSIVLWPQKPGGKVVTHEINLTALEGGSQQILEAIDQYKSIRLER